MKYVIIDIDGTLTKIGDRIKCLDDTPEGWDEFYARCGEDEPVREIINLIASIIDNYLIVLCTGRRESCREATDRWLKANAWNDFYDRLLMRKNGDHRHDTEVKPELLKEAGIKLEDIAFVLEDRSSMVKKWREMGLTCLQVADGDF